MPLLSRSSWESWFTYPTAIHEYQCDFYPGTDAAKDKPWNVSEYEPVRLLPMKSTMHWPSRS